MKIRNKENKTYIILGAPHSATSFISKALQEQGVKMTTDIKKDSWHFKNRYQDEEFVNLNRKILKIVDSSWDNPPSRDKLKEVDPDDEIKKLVDTRKSQKFWGWKDPATSLFFEKYSPHLDGDTYLICCFRKPKKIIKSYKNKDKGRMTKELINRYNKSIINTIKEFCEL